ncbi:hypothetical protein F2Q69_00041847 [Brassica cretica]|uniref:Uncharacterized protein n=1 Tax=Brassica cretica TaxID=69181 RepID=A0A8S9NMD8_BRACR|nr:hypothetical protein F2Q69_00041847 [Brassica cretica]
MGSDSSDKSGSLIHKDSNKRIRTGFGGGNLQGSLHKEFLDISQTEVNSAWWQPPLSLDSWKPVQSWSLKEISSELTIRGRYEEEAIVRCTSSFVDRYRREASTIEDYDRSMYILYHRSMSRREMRDLVPADFKPKASPNYKITPVKFLT